MEFLEKLMFVVVAIICIVIIIGIASNFLKITYPQTKIKIQGDKKLVTHKIITYIYKCFDDNKEKTASTICFEADFKSDQPISSSDILDGINPSRINRENVIADDLDSSGKIIIRYENQSIYVKRVENEGTGV